MTCIGQLHSLLAGVYPFALQTDTLQCSHGVFAAQLVIINNEHRQTGQLLDFFVFLILQLQVNRHHNPGALIELAFNLNLAIHHLDDVLRNSHAQTCTRHLRRALVICTRKGIEHHLLELLAHADAVILNDEAEAAQLGEAVRQLLNIKADFAAVISILDSIRQEVYQHLLNTQTVAADRLMLNMAYINIKVMPMLHQTRLNHGNHIVYKLLQVEVLVHQRNPAAFNTRHIQHLID